jgi:hypothetical protein
MTGPAHTVVGLEELLVCWWVFSNKNIISLLPISSVHYQKNRLPLLLATGRYDSTSYSRRENPNGLDSVFHTYLPTNITRAWLNIDEEFTGLMRNVPVLKFLLLEVRQPRIPFSFSFL